MIEVAWLRKATPIDPWSYDSKVEDLTRLRGRRAGWLKR